MIHVCSLSRLVDTIHRTGARHVVTLLRDHHLVRRPDAILSDNHLVLSMDDIACEIDGFVHPCHEHISQLFDFVRAWDRNSPLVMHCWAGISRSTAAAFVAACALNPGRDESAIARAIRDASPTAMPNTRVVALGDRALERGGRMIEAVERLGPAWPAHEGQPFRLDIE